jgi:hypothetical protein
VNTSQRIILFLASLLVMPVPAYPGGQAFLNISNVTVTEGDIAVLDVVRTGDQSVVTFVSFQTIDGTAAEPDDYQFDQGELSWQSGDSSQRTIQISVKEDLDIEGEEFFSVELFNVLGAELETFVGEVTIEDNDFLNAISINDVTVKETDGTAVFTVSRENSDQSPVLISWQTLDGTAVGDDYQQDSGELLWLDGDGSDNRVIVIPITQDCDGTEPEEFFNLQLFGAVGDDVTVTDDSGTATIIDAPVNILHSSFEQPGSQALTLATRSIDLDTGDTQVACIPEDVFPDVCATAPDLRFGSAPSGPVAIPYPNNDQPRTTRTLKGRPRHAVGPTDVRLDCVENVGETGPLEFADTLIIQTDTGNWYKVGDFQIAFGQAWFKWEKLSSAATAE